MEDNEDEPEDVKKATPVADEIESGTKDEKAGNPKAIAGKKKDDSKPSRCDKNAKKPTLAKSEADCCRSRITRPTKTSKMMSVLVYSPPCTLPRLEMIPRHCLSKQEYIDVLAAPSRKCPTECLGKTVIRRVRPISARMNELAQPARRLIVSTLEERGEMLPPEMIDNLVKSIEGTACMTPEQAEQYFKEKERKRGGKCGKRKATKVQKCREKSKSQCPSSLDKEAVMCQYMMAERFVKSILQWKCPIPVEEFQDIASVILRRLSFVLEYTPLDGAQDIKSQQMRFLADIIACWISGVLFEVAEEHKTEFEEGRIADEQEEEEEEDEDDEDTEPTKPIEVPEEDDEETEKDEDLQEQVETQNPGTEGNDEGDEPTEIPAVIKQEPPDPDGGSAKELEDKSKAEKEAAEKEEARLEAEKKKKQEEEEEKARLEAETKKKEEEEEEKARKEAEKKAEQEAEEKKTKEMEEAAAAAAAAAAENAARLEEEEKERKEAEEEKKRKEAEEEEEKRRKEAEEEEEKKRKEVEEEEEKKRKEAEEEEEKKEQKEAEDKRKREEEEEEEARRKEKQKQAKEAEDQKKKQKEEEDKLRERGPSGAIDKIGDGELFKSDIPFVTFGKILDTIYTVMEDEPEGDESDIVHNRIQRALYEKIANLISLETPEALTENLKDIVDVLSGKTATWLQKLLKDSEVKFMDTHPPEVESREIRDWGKWIDQVTDRAGDWAEWIHRVVNEAETKSGGNVNRGDWQNWTSDTETNALLWRRYYLETVHQAHHNKMMMADRRVVSTGGKPALSPTEEEIQNTDLEG